MGFSRFAGCLFTIAFFACVIPTPAAAAPPNILSVSPTPGATNVPLLTVGMVQIHFDQPMNRTATLDAISVSPVNVAFVWRFHGAYTWLDDQTLSFVPFINAGTNPLLSFPASTTVVITVSTAAGNVGGEGLSAPYQWSFVTKPVVISSANARQSFVAAYQQFFGKAVPEPAYVCTQNSLNQPLVPRFWTSTAYVDNQLYRLYLLEDGTVLNRTTSIRFRPRGTYRVAVVAIDYGNTNIASVLENQWVDAQNLINTAYIDISTSLGLAQPILQFTSVNMLAQSSQIPTPTNRDSIIAFVVSQGYSPSDFDIFVSLSLDAANSSGGFCCPGGDFVFMGYYFGATSFATLGPSQLLAFARSVYDHEIGHAYGWEHEWSPDYVGQSPITEWTLFGWRDTDGDGIPEMLDPSPYGISAQPPVCSGGTYLVGDASPVLADLNGDGDSYDCGEFGNESLTTVDLILALRAVTNLPGWLPPSCSDRFDAMDSSPGDTDTTRGGNALLSTTDLIITLRRTTGIDPSRPRRPPRGLSCP